MRLYAILDQDTASANGLTVPEMARVCLDAGARLLQVRCKTMASGELLSVCDEIAAWAHPLGATLIVNDRVDVARMIEGAGVHVGQDDLSVAAARQILGPERVVGLSTHTKEQVDRALLEPISYLAVGPVFGTRTKATGYEPVGLDLVGYAAKAVRRRAPSGRTSDVRNPKSEVHVLTSDIGRRTSDDPRIPIVAIGGITLDNARSVLDAGASSVAVISDLFTGGDLAARVRAYAKI